MWQPQRGVACSARAAHSCELIGQRLYFFGGWNGKRALNDLHSMDVATGEFRLERPSGTAPSARNNHASVAFERFMLVHGGHDGSRWVDDSFLLDVDEGAWTALPNTSSSPSARACHTLTPVRKLVFMFGGYDGVRCFNDLDLLDTETMVWSRPETTGAQPHPRNAHSMTAVGAQLFLFGGHSGTKHLHDLHILDTAAMRWSSPREVTGTPPPGLRGHSATLVGQSRIFAFGGYDGRGRLNDLFVLDTEALSWAHHAPSMVVGTPTGRQRHSACLIGTKLLIFGGFDGTRWLSDLHRLDVGKMEEDAIVTAARRSLVANLRRMPNNDELFPDVTFVVEGRPATAHRAILSVHSPYFARLFADHPDVTVPCELPVEGISWATFSSALTFVYSGSVDDLGPEHARELLAAAAQFELDDLRTLCQSVLLHHLDVNNVCGVFRLARRSGAPQLSDACLAFIRKNPEAVSETPGFEELGADPQLLLEITRALAPRR